MGREITRRHAALFEKKVHKNPFAFFKDIWLYGKLPELISFVIWETLHELKLYPRRSYLAFNPGPVFRLNGEKMGSLEFHHQIAHFFQDLNLCLVGSLHNWKYIFLHSNGELYGCLSSNDHDLYKSTDNGKSVVFLHRFPQPIKSMFISSQGTIFVCVKGAIYQSGDNGLTFRKTLTLGSSESFFRHNNAMTETPQGLLVIAEYGNVWEGDRWQKLAYLYASADNGESWECSDFLIKQGANKHIHLVKYSRLLEQLIMADGDNYKRFWVSEGISPSIREVKWKLANRFHFQMGGYTSGVETGDKLLLGTDYQGGTNFLVVTDDGKRFSKKIIPDPYRRSPIDNMILRASKRGAEIWANLPYSTAKTKCLLMFSRDGGKRWNKVIEYDRSTHTVWLLNASNNLTNEDSKLLYISIENTRSKDRVVYQITDLA